MVNFANLCSVRLPSLKFVGLRVRKIRRIQCVSCLSTTVSQLFKPQVKKSPFSRTAAHIFVSPGDAPATITQYVPRMERQFNACQTPRSMYLSICNSFRVIRNSMHRSKIRYFYHILVSPGDTPGAITLNVVWMEREYDAYKLSRCMCPSNYNRF